MANIAVTYDDDAVRESLLDVITNISPTERSFFDMLQRSSASQPYHQWPVDTLNAAAANAVVEGSDAGDGGQTNPTRGANYTQIVRKVYEVSDTEKESLQAGFNDRVAYELNKAMKEWHNDAEFALVRGTLVSGSGSVAAQLSGMKDCISTHATSQSGVSLNETTFNTYLGNVWSSGGRVDTVAVGSTLKRRISGFTAGSTKNVDAEDKRLTNSVAIYESDYGVIEINLHRYVTGSGDVNVDIIGVQKDKWAVAFLREPKSITLAKTGSSTKAMVEGEFTLECRAEAANFLGQRHL